MKVKFLIILTILVIFTVGFLLTKSILNNDKMHNPVSTQLTKDFISPTPKKLKLLEYQDPAGFIFSYPENLKLKSAEKLADNYFTALKLINPKDEGEIAIEIT